MIGSPDGGFTLDTVVVTIKRNGFSCFRYVASETGRPAGLFYLKPERFAFPRSGPLIAASVEWSEPDDAYCVTEHDPFTYRDERYTLVPNFAQARIWGLYCAEQRAALLRNGITTLDGRGQDASAEAGFFRPCAQPIEAANRAPH